MLKEMWYDMTAGEYPGLVLEYWVVTWQQIFTGN